MDTPPESSTSTTPNLPVRAAAAALVAVDNGTATLPEPVLTQLRDAVANAAPHCTPAQIANGQCEGV